MVYYPCFGRRFKAAVATALPKTQTQMKHKIGDLFVFVKNGAFPKGTIVSLIGNKEPDMPFFINGLQIKQGLWLDVEPYESGWLYKPKEGDMVKMDIVATVINADGSTVDGSVKVVWQEGNGLMNSAYVLPDSLKPLSGDGHMPYEDEIRLDVLEQIAELFDQVSASSFAKILKQEIQNIKNK